METIIRSCWLNRSVGWALNSETPEDFIVNHKMKNENRLKNESNGRISLLGVFIVSGIDMVIASRRVKVVSNLKDTKDSLK